MWVIQHCTIEGKLVTKKGEGGELKVKVKRQKNISKSVFYNRSTSNAETNEQHKH